MLEPGASKSVCGFLLNNILSLLSTAPTAVEFVMHAGDAMPVALPWFPVAATTAMLFETALLTEEVMFKSSSTLSHAFVYKVLVPKLRLITLILYAAELSMHHSIPSFKSSSYPAPCAFNIFTPTSFASLATPNMLPLAADIPATKVPCPWSSLTDELAMQSALMQSIFAPLLPVKAFLLAKSLCEKLTPVSIMQIVWPAPVIFVNPLVVFA